MKQEFWSPLLWRRSALIVYLSLLVYATTLPKWMFSQKLLFKSSLLQNGKCGIRVYVPQTAATTFAFSFVFILLVWIQSSFLFQTSTFSSTFRPHRTETIEEVWRKKPRQTVVVVFWGKIAAHMAFLDCIADKLIKGRQGQKSGGIFVYNIFYYTSNVLRHSGKYCNPIVRCVLSLVWVCTLCTRVEWFFFDLTEDGT